MQDKSPEGGSVYSVEAAHTASKLTDEQNQVEGIEICKPRTVSKFVEVEHRRYGQTWVKAAASAEALRIAHGEDTVSYTHLRAHET